jgi:hypothetical protein
MDVTCQTRCAPCMWAFKKFHLVIEGYICLLSTSHECVNWCAWWGCVVMMNYCASVVVWIHFSNEISLAYLHNSSTNFPHRQCSLAMHFADGVQSLSWSWHWGWGTTTTSATAHPGRTNVDGGWRSVPVSRRYAPVSQPGCSAWSLGTGTKSTQWFQGLSRHQAPAL